MNRQVRQETPPVHRPDDCPLHQVFWVVLPAFLFSIGLRMDALLPIPWTASPASQATGGVLAGIGLALTALGMSTCGPRGKACPYPTCRPKVRFRRRLSLFPASDLRRLHGALHGGGRAHRLLLVPDVSPLPLLVCGWVGYALFYENPYCWTASRQAYAE